MRQHYAHVDVASGKIVGVNSRPEAVDGRAAILLERELALKLLGGQENPNLWVAELEGETFKLRKLEPTTASRRRVDFLPIAEVLIQPASAVIDHRGRVDVMILVDRTNGELEIHYSGERIKALSQPIKLYATREGDPSYLKCALSLGVNILDAVKEQNDLDAWPNPLRVKLVDGTTDLSLFAPTANKVLAFEKPNA